MFVSVSRLKELRFHVILLGLSLVAILAALVLLWWDVSRQPYLPNTFSYSADAVATETSYDAHTKLPSSTRYLQENLQINLAGSSSNPTLKSTLTSELVAGEKINTIERELPVDTKTGQYLNDTSDEYAFAPRAVTKNQQFHYRYPAYDAAALMHFDGQETINELLVYRYKATYDSDKKLHRATAPDASISYIPDLTIWVEPVTGWLVKYQDNATGYYQNGTLASRIFEKTTSENTRQHTAYAATQKTRSVFADQVVPSLILTILFTLTVSVIIARTRKRAIPVLGAVGVLIAVSSGVLIGWFIHAVPLTAAFSDTATVNPLIAICFILVGIAIVALYKNIRLAVAFIGGIVSILAALQLLGSLGSLPFSLDLLFFNQAVLESNLITPSRMSTYSAFTFLVLGVAIFKAGLTTKNTEIHFAKFMSGIVLALGIFGSLLQLTQIDKLFSLSFMESLPFIIPLLFIVCGFTLLQLFHSIHKKPDDIQSTFVSMLWPSIATVPLILIGIFAQLQQNNIQQTLSNNFIEKTTAFENALDNRINIFSNTLTGMSALFTASEQVTADEFRHYIATYNLKQNLAGIHSMGYAAVNDGNTPPTNIPSAAIPKIIFPNVDSPLRVPVTYTTLDQGSLIGFDLFSDEQLKESMEHARDTGKITLSERTAVFRPDGNSKKTYSILAIPIYQNGDDISTLDARRQAVIGYVFAAIDLKTFIGNIESSQLTGIDFDVYDGIEPLSSSLVYASSDAQSRQYNPRLTSTKTIFSLNHPWTISYIAQPSFQLSIQEEFSPTLILIGGSLTYFAIVTIIYFLVDLERRSRITQRIKRLKR